MQRTQTGVILFSKDRAMQLDAALRSFFRHCQDPDRACVQVLHKASDAVNTSNYAQLVRDYPQVAFVAETDFKPQLMALLKPIPFVLFVVDDTLFVRPFSIASMTRLLASHPEALGFSMRLGRNTGFNYVTGKPQGLPAFEPVEEGVLRYPWVQGKGNFAYPLELSSSLYRQSDILPFLPESRFRSPNTLEYNLSLRAKLFRESKPMLLCFETSAAFADPVNKVQTDFRGNAAGRSLRYDVSDLNRLFREGQRVDVACYDGFVPSAAHQEVPYSFAHGR